MVNPSVSIIITTKNEGLNIGRLLRSVKIQKYKPLEIVVVDNGSSDNTKEIAKIYTSKIFDFGPERSAQRNYGAKKSQGNYLLFLDADMELTQGVVRDVVDSAVSQNTKLIILPERTVGVGFVSSIRKFEREMYMNEPDYEVPRFFSKDVFNEFGGYDTNLTGPEDYDLPYRMSMKYKPGRSHRYILHHEEGVSLINLLRKKYYYASKGAGYATKHPTLVWVQGNILFRKVYFKNWKKFIKNPFLGISFIAVRILESVWALAGFISAVGFSEFMKIIIKH